MVRKFRTVFTIRIYFLAPKGEETMELSRRDFMRNTAAFAAVASVLGTSGIAFAADADQNCLVKVDSPDRAELAKRFKAGSAAGVEYYAYNPRRYAPALKGKLFPPR
jgi:hypothetical protein